MGAVKLKGATSGSTTITAPATGGDETIELFTELAGKLPIAGGKILQIVRATDTTSRSTTSTSLVDVDGMSVTITPQKNDSAILIVAIARISTDSAVDSNNFGRFAVTDSSDNLISGAEDMVMGLQNFTGTSTRSALASLNLWAYATPATTSATTYKLRFRSGLSTVTLFSRNDLSTGQMYAIEVSA
jgi:hypothetical protein